MKKLFIMMVLVISILSACDSTKVSFKEVENVPDNVQEQIDSSFQLQLIEVGKNTSYVVFYSDGDVKADFDTKGNTMTINFNVLNPQTGTKIKNIYFIKSDKNIDVIDVLVNDEPTPFDRVRALYS